MSTSVDALWPAPIAVEERVLEDLRSRLRAAIWPEDDGNEDGRYGVPRALLQELAQYWAEEYDWRAAERAMNAYEHYLVEVSGTRVHFMRKPGAGPDPTPLILSHG
ncbi:MAG TPA: epoxide hydrolase N-terminal domain-containing protein, partial [Streptosporangiaceae bacterium]|nr:epoxide hydrolase N-terminal domain-containing protein [Streptosporangiaceae bacterium]